MMKSSEYPTKKSSKRASIADKGSISRGKSTVAKKNNNKQELKTNKKPLCKHTEDALATYFATLNGDRPGDLYDLVIGEVERPLFQAVMDYTGGLTPVMLVEDGVTRQVRTQRFLVGEVLDDVGIVLSTGDRVSPNKTAPAQARMTIDVRHARTVTVVVDGAVRTVHTLEQTVDGVLNEAGIELRPGDRVRVNGQWASDASDDASADLPASSIPLPRAASLAVASSRGARPATVSSPSLHIEVQRAKVIRLVVVGNGTDSSAEQTLTTRAETLGQALAEAQIPLYLGDRVSPGMDTPVTSGLGVRIRRGASVAIVVDGRTLAARTQAETVGEVLAEEGVSLVGQDFCEPALDTRVQDGLRVQVVRVIERTVVEQEVIPYETEWVADPSLELDHRRLDDAGASGITRRRYKMVYHDGQEVERYLEEEWTAQEPKPRRIVYGTRIVVRTLETPDGPVEYWRRIRVFLTGYTAATCGKSPGDPGYGITRLGWKMRHGIIAVDPRVIRLRSKLYVPGYGPGIAGDTGGGVKGRHIDLGYDEGQMMHHYWWGYVYVLTPVPPPSQIPWILPDYPGDR